MFKRISFLAGLAVIALSLPAQSQIVVDLNVALNLRPSYTLDEVNAQGGILVGDKLFDTFSVTKTEANGGLAPGAGAIAVTGVLVNGELGLRFNGPWSAGSGQLADSTIRFHASIVEPELSQGFLISDNSLWMSAFGAANGGLASITENVYEFEPPGNPATNQPIANKFVFYENDNTKQLFDHKEFIPLPEIWIIKDVIVNGSSNGTGQAHISEFYQTFSQVPEPASLALVAGGVLLLARRRRR